MIKIIARNYSPDFGRRKKSIFKNNSSRLGTTLYESNAEQWRSRSKKDSIMDTSQSPAMPPNHRKPWSHNDLHYAFRTLATIVGTVEPHMSTNEYLKLPAYTQCREQLTKVLSRSTGAIDQKVAWVITRQEAINHSHVKEFLQDKLFAISAGLITEDLLPELLLCQYNGEPNNDHQTQQLQQTEKPQKTTKNKNPKEFLKPGGAYSDKHAGPTIDALLKHGLNDDQNTTPSSVIFEHLDGIMTWNENDLKALGNGDIRWKKNTHACKTRLKRLGILGDNSVNGKRAVEAVWYITDIEKAKQIHEKWQREEDIDLNDMFGE